MRSVQRNMLALLDALDGEPVTLRELARRTGLPLTTVHRAVAPLVAWGGLERTPEGLIPGLRLFELGQLVPQRAQLRELALPYMGDLYAATHEVVSLAVLDGTDTVWIEQWSGRLAPPVPSRVGGRLPAHVTAAGKVLLASAPAAVDALCAGGLDRHGPGTVTDPARLRAELATIAESGLAINREESAAGVLGVAAPIPGENGPIAALALAVARRSRSSPEAMAPAVRTAALAIGRAVERSPTYDGARKQARRPRRDAPFTE
ncbi:IclR family transcriptional regulator [Solirubrobacter sp. CPCC 204708]|uniref:IclR family transcriptional regulator n=1 Tax=Solirubrobacter deserti TaxID=2282478 RepID=A0ABT4RSA0_9ACTN|nr:IclR family transcriptional regulator [Solirubrobacter deserti]MBE2314897.1 IclR family transcriptional regulator [Solirubrobacter deserti]MDA0141126.1 IclR family transcriptional regulator [Solirubrobacter deserti]